MNRDKPVALVTAPLRGPDLDRLRQLADVVLDPWIDQVPLRVWGPDQLVTRIDEVGARILVCEADFCSGPVFERDLLVIGSTRGDPTNVDLEGATAAGIPVLRAPGRNADAVAEMTVALLFAVNRNLRAGDRDMRTGQVFGDTIPYQRFRTWQLAGRTAGLVGLGAVGRATKWRLEGLGMHVLATDPYADDATSSLDELLAGSDVVSMHAPASPETFGLMSAAQFEAMRDGAIYLNTARAGLHDTDALVTALAAGKLAGAGLDHVEGEVLPDDHPLLSFDNVVLTPHIGGATYDVEVNQTTMMVNGIEAVLAGERPPNLANPEVYDR
ncbi:MAG: 3-phosphoglycerate dehydrogenase [Acidimicrobiia bacterium]|nr:3-phosphoglycerate dehydrogenase [Acidimicrobiia bacterium]